MLLAANRIATIPSPGESCPIKDVNVLRAVSAGVLGVALAYILGPPLAAQTREAALVDTATVVLQQIMAVPAQGIPRSLLANAYGVAVIPGTVKIGFVAGFRGGRGIIAVRDDQGAWKPPLFVTLTGGSVGWQAGIQATDVILVFKTRTSVDAVLRGKLTLGADASIAAGPVGRQAEAATDPRLSSEIYSYSRSRGLFAGLALGGSVIQVDPLATNTYYYGTANPPPGTGYGQPASVPDSALRFLAQLGHSTAALGPPTAPLPTMVAPGASPETEAVRMSLAQSAQHLNPILDAAWQRYLALPPEVFTAGPPSSAEALKNALARFDTVANNPQYANLAQRSEFQTTRELLRRYVELATSQPIPQQTLPPPPSN